jgi:hypothetical protein
VFPIRTGGFEVIEYTYGDKTIQEFVLLFDNGQLNLEPGFQRKGVWSLNDRKKLIESILQQYPIPSIFLYQRSDNGRLVYDVIDGKQRLESIFMFQGLGRFRKMNFTLKTKLDAADKISEVGWKEIGNQQYLVMSYKIQTVIVSGELTDIIELFVRINSTGKRLSGAEKRHAKYYHSDFLRQARKLGERYKDYFSRNRILSQVAINRMKNVELVSEIMASIHVGGNIDKKKALDNLISGEVIPYKKLAKISQSFVRTLGLMKKVFPEIRTTRFANAVDFYSLFLLVWDLDNKGCLLNEAKRNRQAQKLLIWLSNGVDDARQEIHGGKPAKPEQQIFLKYLLTVTGSTDNEKVRNQRTDILNKIFEGLFEKKDSKRNFSQEQRRLIWHSEEEKVCKKCKEPLTWHNFTIDHIKPFAKGGQSEISNAALMCKKCNAKKGAK